MTDKFPKRKYIAPVVLLILAAILIPQKSNAGIIGSLFSDITSTVITKAVTYFIQTLVGIFAKMMGFFADLLDKFVNFQNYNLPVIQVMWNQMKNFVNMFFILILIIISFATIFDVTKYSYKSVLPTLIIVALLMNFSLVIGQTIISSSDLLTHAFLAQIKGGPDGGLSKNLMNGFNLQKAVGTNGRDVTAENEQGVTNLALTFASQYEKLLINLVFLLVLIVIALLAFITAALFVFIRTPVLMFLLILSPAAAFLYILPNTRKYFEQWWNAFLSWVFFLPVYVFFLMFAIIFINTRTQPGLDLGTPNSVANFFNFNDIFFYVVTLLFMIYGLVTARKVGSFAAGGVAATVGKIHGGVKKYAGRISGATPVYEGAKEGLAAKGKQIQEKGLFGIGGQQAARMRQARVAELFGARDAVEKAKSAEIEKEFNELKAKNLTKEELAAAIKTAKGVELLAARLLAAQNGWLPRGNAGKNEIEDTIATAGGERTKFAEDYINALKKNNFSDAFSSTAEMEQFARDTQLVTLKKAALETLAKNNDISAEDLAMQMLQLFENDTKEKREAVKQTLQKNMKNIARTKTDRANFLLNPSKDPELRRLMAKQMSQDNEINNYQKYKVSVDLFGGESTGNAQDMLRNIEKEDRITHAEIKFRSVIHQPAANYVPTPAENAVLIDQYVQSIRKMDTKSVASIDDGKWANPQFVAALQQRINELEAADPSQPATGGRRAIAGAGRRFKDALQKSVSGSTTKLPIVRGFRVP